MAIALFAGFDRTLVIIRGASRDDKTAGIQQSGYYHGVRYRQHARYDQEDPTLSEARLPVARIESI